MREPPGPLWGRAASCCCVALLVFRAPEGPAAREARRPRFARRRASKPARALRSLRRPPHRRRMLGASSRSPARPATAHRHRGRSLRRPSHQWGLRGRCFLARRLKPRPGPAAAHRHRSLAPHGPPAPSTPAALAAIASQFRMQFPDVSSPWLHEMPGISTIAC